MLHANPQYVHVRMPTGKEKTVSIRQLAPSGTVSGIQPDSKGNENTSDPPQQPDCLMPQPEPVLNPLLVEPEVPATPVSDEPKRVPLLLKQLQAHNAPGFKEEHLQPIQEGRVTRSRYKWSLSRGRMWCCVLDFGVNCSNVRLCLFFSMWSKTIIMKWYIIVPPLMLQHTTIYFT